MSWTRVSSPANVSVKNPSQQTAHSLSLLNSRISFPDKQSSYVSPSPIIYAPEDCINHYITRDTLNTPNITDTLDTASNLIAAIHQRLWSIANKHSFVAGTSFSCCIHNIGSQSISIEDSEGVHICGQTTIGPGAIAIVKCIVLDQASLGDGHADLISANIMGGSVSTIVS